MQKYDSKKLITIGDIVLHNGVAYKALKPSLGKTPTEDNTYWTVYSDSVGSLKLHKDQPIDAPPYVKGQTYTKGSLVKIKDIVYKAKVGNSAHPEDAPKYWEVWWQSDKPIILPKDNTPDQPIIIPKNAEPIKAKDVSIIYVEQHGFDGKNGLNIKGDKGDKGDTIVGPKGDKGDSIKGDPGINGIDGISLDFKWDGTKLGVKKSNDKEFTFKDLQGPKGDVGRALIGGGGSSNKFRLSSASLTGNTLISSAKPSAAELKTLIAGTGITITPTANSLTIASSGGTVTSVTATSPLFSTGGTTPNISLLVNPNVSVNAASTGALTGTYNNGTLGVGATFTVTGTLNTMDGVTLAVGDTVLLKDQSSSFQNGVYTVTSIGASAVLTRATWFDTSAKIRPGLSVYVLGGSTNLRRTLSTPKTTSFTVGTTAMTWSYQRVSMTQDVTGILGIGSGGTNTSGFGSAYAYMYFDGSSIVATPYGRVNTNTSQFLFGNLYSWIGDERLRIQGTESTPNTPSSPSTAHSGGQASNGYTASGVYHNYHIYGFKDVGGTTYVSATPAITSYTDSSQTVTVGNPNLLNASQDYMYSGYTDSGNSNYFYVVAYKTYPSGFSVSQIGTGTASINETMTFSNYAVQLSWPLVSDADGYFLVSNYGGIDRYQDVGNVTSFLDQNNSWISSSLPYSTPTAVQDTYYVDVNWSADATVDGYIVTVDDSTGRTYDYYQTITGYSNTSLTDDNTGWVATPVLTPNYYYGDALVVEGASYFTGATTFTGNIVQTGNYTLTGDFTVNGAANLNGATTITAGYGSWYGNTYGSDYGNNYGQWFGSVIGTGYGGTGTNSYTTNTLMWYNGSVIGSATAAAFRNTGTGVTHLQLTSSQATNKVLVLKGATSQSGNLFEAQNSSGTVQMAVAPSLSDPFGSSRYAFSFGGNNGLFYTTTNIMDFSIDSGARGLRVVSASVLGTSDTFFQAACSGSGYGIFEGYNGAGTAIATDSSAKPIIFAPARVAKARIHGTGELSLNTTTSLAQLTIVPKDASTLGQVIKAATSQTANITEYQNSSGTAYVTIGKPVLTSNGDSTLTINPTVAPTSSANIQVLDVSPQIDAGSASYILTALYSPTVIAASSPPTSIISAMMYPVVVGGSSVLSAIGCQVQSAFINSGSGATNLYDFIINDCYVASGGFVTTHYGLKINDLSAATTSYAIHTGKGQHRIGDNSASTLIGFYGSTPVVQQANASQAAITAVTDVNAKAALQAIYDLLKNTGLAPATP